MVIIGMSAPLGGASRNIRKQLGHTYKDIISVENISNAWEEFIRGKRQKLDVRAFHARLMDNIVELHEDLVNKTYIHGSYESFYINDPKRRHIHKASVRDRLLHHAIYRILYPFFDHTFIADSFSCRVNKGTHAALERFKRMGYQVSRNNTLTCWILKCDIKKFFASIDQRILLHILEQYIPDNDILWLLKNIIISFKSQLPMLWIPAFLPAVATLAALQAGAGTTDQNQMHKGWVPAFAGRTPLHYGTGSPVEPWMTPRGLPLGNLTSQLLVNIYMNEFDQFVKHKLKVRHYIRYADDFVFLSEDKEWLEDLLPQVELFLKDRLHLTMHPDKVFLKTLASGVDFLGWVHFPNHRVLRSATKRRMWRRIGENPREATMQSYLGLLEHGNTNKTREAVLQRYWIEKE